MHEQTDKENLILPLNALHIQNHIGNHVGYKLSNSTNKMFQGIPSPTKKMKLDNRTEFSLSNPRIDNVLIQFLENEEDSNSKQVIKVELNEKNNITIVCRNIAANMYNKPNTGDLVIQTASAHEEEMDNIYRNSILVGIDPEDSNVRPFTRDFYYFVKDLPSHGNVIRSNVAKYKRRSCLAKYSVTESQETSKKKKWDCIIAVTKSLTLAQNLENEMYSATKMRKSPVKIFQLKHNAKLILELGGGKKVEIEYDPVLNSLVHRTLQTSLDFFLPSAKFFENLLLEVNARHVVSCSTTTNNVTYRVTTNDAPKRTREVMGYKNFLQQQLSRPDIPDKERRMLMDVYMNVKHCDDCNYKMMMRHIVRKHLLGTLCSEVINQTKKLTLQTKITRAKQILQSILFMEGEEENEERNEGTLLLSNNFMTSLHKKYAAMDSK